MKEKEWDIENRYHKTLLEKFLENNQFIYFNEEWNDADKE